MEIIKLTDKSLQALSVGDTIQVAIFADGTATLGSEAEVIISLTDGEKISDYIIELQDEQEEKYRRLTDFVGYVKIT